jgi:type VI secretion system protein VasG
MTSNMGSTSLVTAFEGGEHSPENLIQQIRPEFEQLFNPALMGRITLIPYLPLQVEALAQIITLKLQRLCRRYQQASEGQIQPSFSKRAINWIAERCQVRQSGARDIDQVLNQHLLPLLAEKVLDNNIASRFKIDSSGQRLILREQKKCNENGRLNAT